jgi:hypothetical protein
MVTVDLSLKLCAISSVEDIFVTRGFASLTLRRRLSKNLIRRVAINSIVTGRISITLHGF